ncbi:IS110 family transposase [Rugamonas sp. DEMB1]|uniref:IS110 family transposase n=1 Tax=Rugamonas sp. DEMB1 TaxID=3039386 RepID=UPI002447D327|nr:IS110 family transposase [Rugamonas sp. DEMB1]WGG50572.1 IS110 family transposase [Rugamonas sp. DEMB1]WGG50712.1 IS110 family transposase [Rugamonas sp. DEMB1]WGG51169.1 IS110 family transposase [Rugamonas sp. DEMB1]WGG52523.1 IS110 family transposase [Rugamonas sp. DEMB1]WGG53335.1 IS110 family transposase [Rugamonas sp. DEMB1]
MDTVHAVVGIDVSKKKLDVALLVNGKTKSKVVDNSASGHRALLEWLGKSKAPMAELHVCMEATGVYYEPVALALHAAGLRVSVVNPACIKGFGYSENIRNKNDAVDAGLIARYCVAMAPAPWTPPPIEQRQLRAWSMRVQALKDIRQQEENRLEAHTVTGMDEVAEHVRGHIAWLSAEIAKLEDEIDDHIDRHPGLKHDADLIASIPGVGATTVARILGHLGDIRRFESAKAFAAFLGVTPKQRSSGTSVRGRTMISRTGSTALRAALYMPSLVARRHNPILAQFAERLLATGMAKKAVIGAVMHKLTHLIYGVIHTGKPFDANYLSKGLANQDGI